MVNFTEIEKIGKGKPRPDAPKPNPITEKK